MKSKGEFEAAVCKVVANFGQEYMARGPKTNHVYLMGDLLVIRMQGVLTAAEQHLVKTLPAEKGRDLLKQVRTQLIEIARPILEKLIEDITGCAPRSMHLVFTWRRTSVSRSEKVECVPRNSPKLTPGYIWLQRGPF